MASSAIIAARPQIQHDGRQILRKETVKEVTANNKDRLEMKLPSFLIAITTAIMLMTAGLGYGESSSQNDAQLNSRIQEFMRYQKQQNFDGMWRLMSRKLRGGSSNKAESEKYFKSQGFHGSDFKLQKVVMKGNTALVTVRVNYVANSSRKKYATSREEWKFIREDGTWFFDYYRTLSTSLDKQEK